MARPANAGLLRNQTINFIWWILFWIKFQTTSARTWSFVHFSLSQTCLQARHNSRISERLKLKDDAVPTICIWQYCHNTQVFLLRIFVINVLLCDNCFITIVLSLSQIVLYVQSICIYNLNHYCVHLWRTRAFNITTVSQSQQWISTSESTIITPYSNRAFRWGG